MLFRFIKELFEWNNFILKIFLKRNVDLDFR